MSTALFGSQTLVHICIRPVFRPVTTIGKTQGDASIFSMTPALSKRSSSAETEALTEKGRHHSFCHTGLTVGSVFTLGTKLCAQLMSGGAGIQEEGAEVVVSRGVGVAVVSTGAVEAVVGGRTVLPLMQMSSSERGAFSHNKEGSCCS